MAQLCMTSLTLAMHGIQLTFIYFILPLPFYFFLLLIIYRCYMNFDIMRRVLEQYFNLNVIQVMNITGMSNIVRHVVLKKLLLHNHF